MAGIGVLVALAALAVGLLVAWPAFRHATTFPGGTLEVGQGDPALWGLPGAEEVRITTTDRVRLHGWWIPAEGRRCGAVVYFHGNANTIAPRAWLGRKLADRGLDVLMVDYRGYGLSAGRPSETGLREDARAVWRHAVESRGVRPDRLVILGHSLGSAVALDLALEQPAAALVLGAPFPGLPDAFRAHVPGLPIGMLPWREDRFEAGRRIGDLDTPLLVLVGRHDRLVPPALSRKVYDAAPEPRRLVTVDADHNTLLGHPDSWRAMDALLRRALGCGAGAEKG